MSKKYYEDYEDYTDYEEYEEETTYEDSSDDQKEGSFFSTFAGRLAIGTGSAIVAAALIFGGIRFLGKGNTQDQVQAESVESNLLGTLKAAAEDVKEAAGRMDASVKLEDVKAADVTDANETASASQIESTDGSSSRKSDIIPVDHEKNETTEQTEDVAAYDETAEASQTSGLETAGEDAEAVAEKMSDWVDESKATEAAEAAAEAEAYEADAAETGKEAAGKSAKAETAEQVAEAAPRAEEEKTEAAVEEEETQQIRPDDPSWTSDYLASAAVGDTVTYGAYEQDNDFANGQEALEWIVLDKAEDGSMLLISKYGLDAQGRGERKDRQDRFDWAKSNHRTWLNDEFLNTAFTATEQKVIRTTELNNQYELYGKTYGTNTEDKVFLLSKEEVEKYFSEQYSGICVPTAYAKDNAKAWTFKYKENIWYEYGDFDGNCAWWLRTDDDVIGFAGTDANVAYTYYGYLVSTYGGTYEGSGGPALRPAIWVTP